MVDARNGTIARQVTLAYAPLSGMVEPVAAYLDDRANAEYFVESDRDQNGDMQYYVARASAATHKRSRLFPIVDTPSTGTGVSGIAVDARGTRIIVAFSYQLSIYDMDGVLLHSYVSSALPIASFYPATSRIADVLQANEHSVLTFVGQIHQLNQSWGATSSGGVVFVPLP